MNMWSEIRDGTSIGPTAYIEGTTAVMVSAQALWSDTEGIGVALEIGDGLITRETFDQWKQGCDDLVKIVSDLLDLTPPDQKTHPKERNRHGR